MFDRLLLFLMFLYVNRDAKSRFLSISIWSSLLALKDIPLITCVNLYSKLMLIMSEKAYVLFLALLYPHFPSHQTSLEDLSFPLLILCPCAMAFSLIEKRPKTLDPSLTDLLKALSIVLYPFSWKLSSTALLLCEIYQLSHELRFRMSILYLLCLYSSSLTLYCHLYSWIVVLLGLCHDIIPEHSRVENLVFDLLLTYMTQNAVKTPEDLSLSIGTLWMYFFL